MGLHHLLKGLNVLLEYVFHIQGNTFLNLNQASVLADDQTSAVVKLIRVCNSSNMVEGKMKKV